MSRPRPVGMGARRGFPRVSGDEPKERARDSTLFAFSPREWG